MDRFVGTPYDVSACSTPGGAGGIQAAETSPFPSPHSFNPAHQQSYDPQHSPTFSGPDTPIDTYSSGSFENLPSALHGFDNPQLPSFQETYNIHGTYAYMRQEDIKPDIFGSFRDEPADVKPPPPLQYHGQYQAFTDAPQSFLEQTGVFGQDFPAGMSAFSGDQKDVFPGFQPGSQPMFQGDRPGFQGYQPGYYGQQRMASTESTFTFPSQGSSAMFTGGRPAFQRRSSMPLGCPEQGYVD